VGTSRQPLGAVIVPVNQNRQFALLTRSDRQPNTTALPLSCLVGRTACIGDCSGVTPSTCARSSGIIIRTHK
jgi:hypothetical protein